MLPTDSAAYLSLPYLFEAVPDLLRWGTYLSQEACGGEQTPYLWEGADNAHGGRRCAARHPAILDEGGDAAERVPLPPSPLRFKLWTVQQTLRPGMVNVHIRTSVMLQNVSGVWGARYMAR